MSSIFGGFDSKNTKDINKQIEKENKEIIKEPKSILSSIFESSVETPMVRDVNIDLSSLELNENQKMAYQSSQNLLSNFFKYPPIIYDVNQLPRKTYNNFLLLITMQSSN